VSLGDIVQAVLETGGSTKFAGTTIHHLLIFADVLKMTFMTRKWSPSATNAVVVVVVLLVLVSGFSIIS